MKNYQIPPSIHQYETKFYGMSMTGLLVAAMCLIVSFLICTSVFNGMMGLIMGVVVGLVVGLVGWAMVTPFNSMDNTPPPRYWLRLFLTRNDREIVMPEFSQTAIGMDGDAVVTDWSGEEIARL